MRNLHRRCSLTACPASPEDVIYTERDLIEGLRQRDARMCEVFFRRESGRMLAVARRIVRCEQEAQDVLQDALISVMQAIHTFNGESQLRTWLHRITVNAALMRVRKNARHCRCRAYSESVPDEATYDDHHADANESAELLHEAIQRLPVSYRQVIELRDLREHDTETTARLLSCSEANVKTRLHRARRALHAALAGIDA